MAPPSNAMAASAGAGWIDDFRLWGSRRCRRINAPLKKTWWRTQVAHAFDNHNASLSEGGALAVVVWHFPETRHWTRNNEHFPRPLRQSEARLCLAFPPLARRASAPHERSAGGGSAPPFLTAAAAPASVHRRTQWRTINTPLEGVAPSTVIPAGRQSGWLKPRNFFQRYC